ncbi:epoxide hydrolase family protein [Kutzneria kofuensis]|uniref:Pimeloyl-ACP methyl ester carboxylesterase n=1 Tax=Kutzneria kofuensis TaxID=103725 RepID=A0A7W9KEI1_9PSEU|nr:epoxide hydrolase family protein [Kutzneria kofuensis]MBB5890703.1 pimeloyl-ACP methyl ester carboxylesterase [Kutzneria kofuensis]
METFRIEVPDAELADLRDRLARIRWAPEPPADDYGVSGPTVRKLVEHWRDGYDWRAVEARLNAYPQFTTTIDGANVHFLHVRSPEPDALPLILTHGWPGSVTEYLDVIGPLTDPRAYGFDPAVAFHLVIPSLPGFGWSGPVTEPGWGPRRIAAAWTVLMERLGYSRYGAAGNDWGAVISPEVGRTAPDSVIGVHVTQIFSGPEGDVPFHPPTVEPASVATLPPDERALVAGLRHFQRTMASYHHVHAEQPQTLAYALADSPVGLLAWNSQVMGGLDADALLTHVSIHWLTNTAGSAPRIYLEDHRNPVPSEPTTVPLGLAQFPNDAPAIPTYAHRDHANIVSWNVHDRGGHYGSQQAPDLYVDDVRQFFAQLRP